MTNITKKNIVSFCAFILVVLITFILPMHMPVPSYGYYAILLVVTIAITIFLSYYNFSVFVPALFFATLYLSRPLVLFFANKTNMAFPGFMFLLPIIIYLLVVLSFQEIKTKVSWLCWGQIDKTTWILIISLVLISTLALVTWAFFIQKDLSVYKNFVPQWPTVLLIFGGLGFAISNSIVEEFLARAVLWDGFDKLFDRVWMVIGAQALVFAAWHFRGFPGGITGFLLVFVWSILLGIIRHRSKGMLAPILAHFFADLVIFFILFRVFGYE